MTNAVIYARYSPGSSQTEQSIDGQLQVCRDYALRNNYNIINVYTDRMLTATNDARPSFQQMLSDAKKRQFEVVLVYKLDRFARNKYDSVTNKRTLQKLGVRVVSAMENITDSPEGILLVSVIEGYNEYYSVELGQKVKRGQKLNTERGLYTGGMQLLGYKVLKEYAPEYSRVVPRIIIDEDKAKIVRYSFERFTSGATVPEIVRECNAKGWTNSRGKAFSEKSFSSLFKNKKYIGITTYNGIEVAATYPAIVSEETFRLAQTRFREKKQTGGSNAKADYLLSGKAYCGYCESSMVGESARGKYGMYYYYTCAEAKKNHGCKKHREKKDFLEGVVVDVALKMLTPQLIDSMADKALQIARTKAATADVVRLKRDLDRLHREMEKLVDVFVDAEKGEPRRILNERMRNLAIQIEDTEIEYNRVKCINGVNLSKEGIALYLSQFKKLDVNDFEVRRLVIDLLVNAVYLFDDDITVYINLSDGINKIKYEEFLQDAENILGAESSNKLFYRSPKRTPNSGVLFGERHK
jgi:DNA invertase Pin-like site-specific DNA recombinase